MRPSFVRIVLSQGKKREESRDETGGWASASGDESEEADAKEPDRYHCRQPSCNQTIAKESLCTASEQVEKRSVEISAVYNRLPNALGVRQPTKIDGEEFIEPKAFATGPQGNIREVNGG